MPRPVIIDTDPGIDDAVAILLALASPELALEAIVAVAGNATLGATARNACAVLELVENPTGCCGQAGSFGYERDHYAVSMTIAEQALLPAVRRATDETLIAADGFSCREQIEHGSARHALHPAEIVALALKERHIDSARAIEAKHRQPAAALHPAALGGAAAAVAAGGALLFWLSARNRR